MGDVRLRTLDMETAERMDRMEAVLGKIRKYFDAILEIGWFFCNV